MLEIFDRWLIRRKIALITSELVHAQDSDDRRALEQELAAERETLNQTLRHGDEPTRH